MEATSNIGRSRLRRRLFVGTSIGTGAVVLAAQQASAATSATFGNGVLTVLGDNSNSNIAISRDAAGRIVVNGGAVNVIGGTPTVANTSVIQVFGLGGNDTVRLDETGGALPRSIVFGGAGNDALTGGSGGDLLFGQAGNDTLLGQRGGDLLFGGAGNDVLTGGEGNDVLNGGPGNDVIDGGDGDDIEIQLIVAEAEAEARAAGDTVTSATVADEEWLANHARIVDGMTVLDVGGKDRVLPTADLTSLLVQDVPTS